MDARKSCLLFRILSGRPRVFLHGSNTLDAPDPLTMRNAVARCNRVAPSAGPCHPRHPRAQHYSQVLILQSPGHPGFKDLQHLPHVGAFGNSQISATVLEQVICYPVASDMPLQALRKSKHDLRGCGRVNNPCRKKKTPGLLGFFIDTCYFSSLPCGHHSATIDIVPKDSEVRSNGWPYMSLATMLRVKA